MVNLLNKLSYIQHSNYKLTSTIPWNIQMINAPTLWNITKGGGKVIAVVDTGLDINHPEFVGRIYKPTNCTGIGAYNDVKPIEDYHGQHVAGIAAGTTVGVAPEARIMPIKVFGGRDVGQAIRDAFIKIIEHNRTCDPIDKVVAINCSFGSANYDSWLAYNIRTLVTDGVVIVASAGNSGDGNSETHEIFSYPAYIFEVLTTGSVNQDETIANYSNSFDGIDVVAPGSYIYSAWKNNGYTTLSGTSMSAPHITGTCALLADIFYQKYDYMPLEGDLETELFGRIKHIEGDNRLFGRGILDLSIKPNIACKKGYMWLNNKIALIDSIEKTMDQALTYDPKTSRTLAPVRFVFENAGYNIEWNQERQEVHFWK